MKSNVLKMDIYQPFAHYREPKIMQDDFIPTLSLPTPTTVSGLISYLIDRQAKSIFKIGIVGSYENKVVHFMRGETGEFWRKFSSFTKKKKVNNVNYNDWFTFFKDKKAKNRIMNFEILQDVNLTIFISVEDHKEYRMIKEALENPRKYLALGRKEDFFVPKKPGKIVQEVTINEVDIKNKKQAIIKNSLLKNTYIPVSLNSKSEREEMKNRLRTGVLYTLPKTYKDLLADKKDRMLVYGHYIYLNDEGYYPSSGKVQVYEDEYTKKTITFQWL
ncbi:CRISPR-associated protein Cas5 [Herbivorax sp. ANBcel31]|uniref:CRISPR-associated protein Cas5 n=1 Tax=Herbivorax sp. ANBcel31 TaxID=3069754 RepID=UPI0027B646A3|nr:CRISPR-associated protein Cas5 [Herbivorax sp. ANBcel31]MDQ2086772.1 CRISPR-associated protein Cas5 [Herbivorax sp. ANBcel31]